VTPSRRKRSAKGAKAQKTRLWIWAGYTLGEGYAVGMAESGMPEKTADEIHLGRPITEMPRRFKIRELTSGVLPDVLRAPNYNPLVSDRVRAVLEKLSRANIQFVPVRLEGYRGESYWLPHVLDELALVDRKRSKVKWYPDDPRYIKRAGSMVLRDPPPGAPLYFRLQEIPAYIIDDELRQALQKVTPSAGHFMKPWDLGY
jgi:hypothetical protein